MKPRSREIGSWYKCFFIKFGNATELPVQFPKDWKSTSYISRLRDLVEFDGKPPYWLGPRILIDWLISFISSFLTKYSMRIKEQYIHWQTKCSSSSITVHLEQRRASIFFRRSCLPRRILQSKTIWNALCGTSYRLKFISTTVCFFDLQGFWLYFRAIFSTKEVLLYCNYLFTVSIGCKPSHYYGR